MKRKYGINATALIYNKRTQRLLLVEKQGRYGVPALGIPSEAILTGDHFPASVSKYLSDLLRMTLGYVGVLDASVELGFLTLYVLLSTNDAGDRAVLSKFEAKWVDTTELSGTNSPDHLLRLAHEAIDIEKRQTIAVELSSLSETVSRKAVSFLAQKLVRKGDAVGWPHYLGTEAVGALGTAIGVLCYLHAGLNSPSIAEGLGTIRQFQNEDGGWPVKSLIGRSNISVTESALWSLWALIEAGFGSEDQSVVKGIQWLEKTQKQSGGWGSSQECKRERVFPTAFAVRVLSLVDPDSSSVRLGVSWLQNARGSDGGWGAFSSESANSGPSTALHTAHAALALMATGVSAESDIIRDAVKRILSGYSEQTEEGWASQSEIEYVNDEDAVDYRHFTTPWCVVALMQAGIPLFQEEIINACRCLISKQNTLGYWTHRLTPGQIPIWATHDCLLALSQVVTNASCRLDLLARTVDLERESVTLRRALLDFVNAVVGATKLSTQS